MTSACKYQSEMVERLLSSDRPMNPSPADVAHCKICSSCEAAFNEIKELETDLNSWASISLANAPAPKVAIPDSAVSSPASGISMIPVASSIIALGLLGVLTYYGFVGGLPKTNDSTSSEMTATNEQLIQENLQQLPASLTVEITRASDSQTIDNRPVIDPDRQNTNSVGSLIDAFKGR